MSDEAAIGWIREVVLDCAEPWALALPGQRPQAGFPTPGTGRPSSR